jgi:adenylate cyclase
MERPDLKRRLTAVLLADVVGYSRLMSADEEGTHRRLSRALKEVIEPKTAQYGGRMIRSMGDGLLVEFDSALDAVRCGIEIQTALPGQDLELAADLRIRLRIGINTGDVMRDERDIYGHSINIAARLEQLAEPGTVYVSSGVHDQLRGTQGLSFVDRGQHLVKNIDHPIHVFRVEEVGEGRGRFSSHWPLLAARLRVAGGFRRLPPVALVVAGLIIAGAFGLSTVPIWRGDWNPWRQASILVLPFKNLGNDPAQDYLADAVTVDLTTDLSRLRNVLVIAPATALSFKGKAADPRRISREIGVRYVVAGGIRRAGAQVVTNAQLINAASGVQIWADRLENKFEDLEDLEAAVTGRIAASLDVQLIKAESRRAAQVAQPDALDLRLRAEAIFFGSVTPKHTLAARRLLEQAVVLDPNSAEAWARLAEITASDYLVHWNDTGPRQLREADEADRKALALDPNLALSHLANGFIHRAQGDHQAALEAFSHAIELDPNFALAYVHKADELILLGRPGEAPPFVEHAIKLSPRDPSLGIFYWVRGRAHFYAGQYREAIPWLRKSVEVRPNLWFNRLYLASAYALLGEREEAGKTLAAFNRRFSHPVYTVALVQSHEHRSTSDNAVVVAAHAKFYEGLRRAGMAAR